MNESERGESERGESERGESERGECTNDFPVSATVSEHTMLLEGVCSRPPQGGGVAGPVSGVQIMRKLSKSHAHNESGLKIKVSD